MKRSKMQRAKRRMRRQERRDRRTSLLAALALNGIDPYNMQRLRGMNLEQIRNELCYGYVLHPEEIKELINEYFPLAKTP